MNEKVTSITFASNQKINNIIKKAYNKTLYFVEKKFHSNEKYDYDNDEMINDLRKFVEKIKKTTIKIKNNAIKVVNILEAIINNDVTKNKKISLFLRFKLQRQNANMRENQITTICNKY